MLLDSNSSMLAESNGSNPFLIKKHGKTKPIRLVEFETEIVSALRRQLSWTHLKILIWPISLSLRVYRPSLIN